MIKWKQQGMGFENYGLEYSDPDFVKYTESFGGNRPQTSICFRFSSSFSKSIKFKRNSFNRPSDRLFVKSSDFKYFN